MADTALDEAVEQQLRRRLRVHLGQSATVDALWPTGHYPRTHVAADVTVNGRCLKLFLKCLKPERKDVEMAAYERVLPLVTVSTPRLLAKFADWEYPTQWLALERVEGRWVDRRSPEDLQAVLMTLGRLHAESAEFSEEDIPACLRYPNAEDEVEEQRLLGDIAARGAEIELDRAVLGAAERNLEFLRTATKTLTHGDNDVSNLLVTPGGIYLLDWETARWSSPAVDLGNVLAWLPPEFQDMTMLAYLKGIEEAGGVAPDRSELDQLVAHGRFLDGLRMIGIYMQRGARDSPADWFEAYVAPRIARLNELAAGAVV